MRGVLKLLHGQHPDMKVGITCCAGPWDEGGCRVLGRALADVHMNDEPGSVPETQATKAVSLTPKVHQQNGIATRNSKLHNGELHVDVADSRTRAKIA